MSKVDSSEKSLKLSKNESVVGKISCSLLSKEKKWRSEFAEFPGLQGYCKHYSEVTLTPGNGCCCARVRLFIRGVIFGGYSRNNEVFDKWMTEKALKSEWK